MPIAAESTALSNETNFEIVSIAVKKTMSADPLFASVDSPDDSDHNAIILVANFIYKRSFLICEVVFMTIIPKYTYWNTTLSAKYN